MIFLRSLVFNVLFYLNLIARMVFLSPQFFLGSEDQAWRVVRDWASSSLWLLDKVAGVRSSIGGYENVPAGAIIIAAKHQSFWDVFALLPHLDRPTFILKKELMGIPLFGAYARRLAMIPVDRSKRSAAIASMVDGAKRAAAEGRQIFIFPEGTRTVPGAAPDYKQGVFRLYDSLGLQVVPVALNSGLYWPRRSVVRRPGTIRAEILPAIESGLARDMFIGRLRSTIETASDDLLAQAYARDGYRPMPIAPPET